MGDGRKGEAFFCEFLAKFMQVDETADFTRKTITNAADGGKDFELTIPHNSGEVFDSILNDSEDINALSKTTIKARVDYKNYASKIGQVAARKFVKDIDRNSDFSEHWLVGGNGLTRGAKNTLDAAKKENVIRTLSKGEISKLNSYYTIKIESENINDNENN